MALFWLEFSFWETRGCDTMDEEEFDGDGDGDGFQDALRVCVVDG